MSKPVIAIRGRLARRVGEEAKKLGISVDGYLVELLLQNLDSKKAGDAWVWATEMHVCFYEGRCTEEDVEVAVKYVKKLVEELASKIKRYVLARAKFLSLKPFSVDAEEAFISPPKR